MLWTPNAQVTSDQMFKTKNKMKTQKINMKNNRVNPDCRVRNQLHQITSTAVYGGSHVIMTEIFLNLNFQFRSNLRIEKFIREMTPSQFIQRAPLWALAQHFILFVILTVPSNAMAKARDCIQNIQLDSIKKQFLCMFYLSKACSSGYFIN